jgi:protein TonB
MMELKKHEKFQAGGAGSRSVVCEPEHAEGDRPSPRGGAFSNGGRHDGCLEEGIIGDPVVSAEEGAAGRRGREWLLVGFALSLALHAAVILFARMEKTNPAAARDLIEIEFHDAVRYAEIGPGETAPDDETLRTPPAIEPKPPASAAAARRPAKPGAAALRDPPPESENTETVIPRSLPEAPVRHEEPETIEDPVMQFAVVERGEPELEAADHRGEPDESDMARRPDERLIDGGAAPAAEAAAGVARENPPDHGYAVKGFVERIDGRKVYPYPARKKGMQGTVLMLVRLDVDGELLEVRVLRSSNYGILDKAAVSLVRKVVPYPHNTGVALEMKVPIRYTLLD